MEVWTANSSIELTLALAQNISGRVIPLIQCHHCYVRAANLTEDQGWMLAVTNWFNSKGCYDDNFYIQTEQSAFL